MKALEGALKYLEERFSIDRSVFEPYYLFEKGDIWITSKEAGKLNLKNYSRKGIRLIRVFKDGFKLTTAGIQLFGKYAKRNIVEIKEEQLEDYIKGKDIFVGEQNCENGQVIVKFGNDFIGSGLYVNGKLKNQIPKGRRWF